MLFPSLGDLPDPGIEDEGHSEEEAEAHTAEEGGGTRLRWAEQGGCLGPRSPSPFCIPGPPWSVSWSQGRALWGEDLTGRGPQGRRKDSELATAPPHPTPSPLHALAGSLEERAARASG